MGAAFAQVAQCGAAVRATFTVTVELAEQEYGYVQFFGEHLRLSACLCHFLFAVSVMLFGLHVAELQVVDDDKGTLPLALL